MNNTLKLFYNKPAEFSLTGWQNYSIPIGNGIMGANIFGGYKEEKITTTSNTMQNSFALGGLTSFAIISAVFKHSDITQYERGLNIEKAVAYCKYTADGVEYRREYFTSYPDNCLAIRFECDEKKINTEISLDIAALGERSPAEGGKTGNVVTENDGFLLRGELVSRKLLFEAQLKILTDGYIEYTEKNVIVSNAYFVELYYVQGTSFKLEPSIFTSSTHYATGNDPHKEIVEIAEKAIKKGYVRLKGEHIKDYKSLFDRVDVSFGAEDIPKNTDVMLEELRSGKGARHLERLYYQYGRYLLISSARKGGLPPSLQGIWSYGDKAPWGSGFWHNINIQMNYWPAFSTNLAETFEPYLDYAAAYKEMAENYATDYIKEIIPENYEPGQGKCGWIIGTENFCCEIGKPGMHSGPGTGGLTSQMFWDYYDFTRDKAKLEKSLFGFIEGMSLFLTKCVKKYGDKYLSAFSASPEQMLTGTHYIKELGENQMYYHTVGCAFDQQMIYENGKNLLRCAEVLNADNEIIRKQREQINSYEPVIVGKSGQIKEYREEKFYGEIGEAKHRHLSQLVALMPGDTINQNTPVWLDAAKNTLRLRGDNSTGWALAHRLCLWARTGDGDHAYKLLKNLLKDRTYYNLWDKHPPFQIDGNFGAVAGITEMLLQSHCGVINLIPALPKEWSKSGYFRGLRARGDFTVDCEWSEGCVKKVKIHSGAGETAGIKWQGLPADLNIVDECGNAVDFGSLKNGAISFKTQKGQSYYIDGCNTVTFASEVENVVVEIKAKEVKLKWDKKDDCEYRIWRSDKNYEKYELIGQTREYCYSDPIEVKGDNAVLYRITAFYVGKTESESKGVCAVAADISRLESDMYFYRLKQNNL